MQPVVIVSADAEFASVMREQIEVELGQECMVSADGKGLSSDIALVVSDGTNVTVNAPLVTLTQRPIRVQAALAQIASLLALPAEEIALGGDYTLRMREKLLVGQGQSVNLTDREAELLAALAASGDTGMSKDELLTQVWKFEASVNTHTLETHIYRLRGKIRDAFECELIEAVDGNYRLAL